MDLSTIEQKLDDSKYKTLNEVRMFTFILKKNCGMAAVKDTSYFCWCPSGKKIVHCIQTSFEKPLPNYSHVYQWTA